MQALTCSKFSFIFRINVYVTMLFKVSLLFLSKVWVRMDTFILHNVIKTKIKLIECKITFQVTKSFFYLLLVYIFFILSFALGFYVLFNKEYNLNSEKKGTTVSSKKNDYKFFNTTWQTFVKASTKEPWKESKQDFQ